MVCVFNTMCRIPNFNMHTHWSAPDNSESVGEALDMLELDFTFKVIMTFLTSMTLTPSIGIETNINTFYGEFSTIPRWNMC
jgi:hypothetical protein